MLCLHKLFQAITWRFKTRLRLKSEMIQKNDYSRFNADFALLVFVIVVLQKFTNNNNERAKKVNPVRVPRNIGITMMIRYRNCLVFHFTAIESELKTIWNAIVFSGEKKITNSLLTRIKAKKGKEREDACLFYKFIFMSHFATLRKTRHTVTISKLILFVRKYGVKWPISICLGL